MPHPKIPKHLISRVQRTGYGYISDDSMYRLFRYKQTASYHTKEPQRWMLLKPDGGMEYFETMVEGRKRIYDLQRVFETELEKKEAKAEKGKNNKIKQKGKKKTAI